MSNLVEKWALDRRERRSVKVPTSVRLRPAVDAQIEAVVDRFPHLTRSQVINDLLAEGLDRIWRSGVE